MLGPWPQSVFMMKPVQCCCGYRNEEAGVAGTLGTAYRSAEALPQRVELVAWQAELTFCVF